MCRVWFIRFYNSISRLFHLACLYHNFHFLDQRGSALESIYFESRACKIEQWILKEFHFEWHDSFHFCAGIWVISSPLSIGTLNADSSGELGFCLYQAFQDLPRFPKKPFCRARKKEKRGSFQNKTRGGSSPHFHRHSMGELLLNPNYNQRKLDPNRYIMLNRGRDRERGLPFFVLLALRDKS